MTCLFCLCCDCTGGITTLNGCLISSFTTRLPANYNNPMQTVLDPKPSQNPQRPKTLHKPELKTALNTAKLECWTIPIRLPSLHPPLFHNHEKRSSFLLLQLTTFKIKNQLAIPNINNAIDRMMQNNRVSSEELQEIDVLTSAVRLSATPLWKIAL